MTIGVIACGNTKRTEPARAQDLYVGPLFRAYRAWITGNCDRWVILSAKHGVLEPDQVIEPYDVTLKRLNARQLASWYINVRWQLCRMFNDAFYLVLGGARYRTALDVFPHSYPMAGLADMRFGKQLGWLKRNPVWSPT